MNTETAAMLTVIGVVIAGIITGYLRAKSREQPAPMDWPTPGEPRSQSVSERFAALQTVARGYEETSQSKNMPLKTPQLPGACTVQVENGTMMVCLPNGEPIPKQTDCRLVQDFDPHHGPCLAQITVTLFVNLVDTVKPKPERTRPNTNRPVQG